MTVDKIINELNLEPHPEGGYFSEVYRSGEIIEEDALPSRYKGERCISTSIYFLLEKEQFSTFHKLKSDETWHFYLGSSLILHLIFPTGKYEKIIIGRKITEGEKFQFTVPRGCWFAAEVTDKSSFSLIGCTVSPGFEFDDFEMGERTKLISEFPQHKDIIYRLTN